MIDPTNAAEVIRVRCNACGFVGPLNDFDVMGANPNKLFCNCCGHETDVDEIAEVSPKMQTVTEMKEAK